jgi:XTP/dITP diphosphohydrolase
MESAIVVLGTRNRKKRDELVELLDLPGLQVVTLAERPPVPEVIEDGETFAENAAKKASETAKALGEWVLGEDSGLCVDALGGAPGIYSARYAGEPCDDGPNNDKLLGELKGIELEQRTAHYVCSIAVADPSGAIRARAEGYCHGRIATAARGSNGFGYDPLFLFGDGDLTFGELPSDFKRQHSHRAAAVKDLRPQMQVLFGRSGSSRECHR